MLPKIQDLRSAFHTVKEMDQHWDELKFNQGVIQSYLHKVHPPRTCMEAEFCVFSQWGEDGIIQYLVNQVELPHKTFIEFGVEDYFESNTRFLLMKDNWSGYVIDGSTDNIERLKKAYFYWRYDLQAQSAFITKENINELLKQSGFTEELGILSIDVDGNDYWLWDAITYYKPIILICEYNSVFGAERPITVPYDPAFYRTQKHFSNLYFGASLPALVHLAEKRGYSLVATASNGGNAFFIRNDKLVATTPVLSIEEGYRASKYRESRDAQGNLTYLRGEERLQAIRGLPVVNVVTGATELL